VRKGCFAITCQQLSLGRNHFFLLLGVLYITSTLLISYDPVMRATLYISPRWPLLNYTCGTHHNISTYSNIQLPLIQYPLSLPCIQPLCNRLTKKYFSCYHYYNLLYCCCIQHILNYLCYKCMLYQNCCFEALTISWRLPWTGSCVLPFVTCADTDDNNVPTSWFPWR